MDRATNGNETDLNCGGVDCPACKVGDVCDQDEDCDSMICDGGQFGPICAVCADGRKQTINQSCGYGGRGKVEQTCTGGVWIDTACLDVYYRSCQEILEDDDTSPSGEYEIDPDGPANLYDTFDVYCDMMTDGGGWTEITACLAKQRLNAVVVAVDPAADAGNGPNCSYETQDEGADGHTYHMTFDWPDGFREFYLQGYEIRGIGLDPANTSDLGFVQADWDKAAEDPLGDVSFGSAAKVGPETSYSRQPGIGNTSCFDCVISWPNTMDIYDVDFMSTKFRIGWGEAGPQTEGWNMWWNGAIFVRDAP
jgi:hypothetical protein